MNTQWSANFVGMACIAVLFGCGGAATGTPPAPSPSPTILLVPMGVDYGLKRQCIRTPDPFASNFFVDNVDCPVGAYPVSGDWITVAEIENPFVPLMPCVGTTNGQSVLINGPGSPVTQHWHGSSSTGYTFDVKVDYGTIANPCAAPTWSATGLIDNQGFSNAQYPRPDQAILEFDATFNMQLRGAGAVHASAELATSWLASGYSLPIQVSTEVELWDNPNALGCGAPPGSPPDVLCSGSHTDPGNGITYFYVVFDGSKLNPAIQTPLGVPTHIKVNWGTLITRAIADGIFPPPQNGWAGSQAGSRQSNDSVVGLEIRNDIAGSGGPMGELVVSNYRLYGLVPIARK